MDYRNILVTINYWRTIPFYYMCIHSCFKEKVEMDLIQWKKREKQSIKNQILKRLPGLL